MHRRHTATAILALAALAASHARAAGFDHLKAYKVTERTSLRLVADLDALQKQYDSQHCSIRGGPKLFLVPVGIANVQPPVSAPPFDPEEARTDYICYRVSCPESAPNTAATDEFGLHALGGLRPALVCAPARKGCGDTSPPQCGGLCPAGQVCGNTGTSCACRAPSCADLQPPQCAEGTCAAGGEACGNVGGACGCIPPPLFCGDATGPAQCALGLCPAGETCVSTAGTGCGCVPSGATPCSGTDAPQCGGVCPPSESCVPLGPEFARCGCVPAAAVPCLDAADQLACDGACPPGLACVGSSNGCYCHQLPGPRACGDAGGFPLCWGDCDDPQAPICNEVNGACVCTP